MIRSEHVREDLEKLKKKAEGDVSLKDVAHTVSLVCKILLDIRQNQVLIIKHKGIELSTSKKDTPRTEN